MDQDCAVVKGRVAEAIRGNLGRVVLDLSTVPFVDSKGLEVLVELTEDLGQSGQSLRLCGVNKTVREVLDLTELTNAFEHFEDSNTAVRSFL